MKYTRVIVRQVVQKRQFEPIDISIEAELEDGDNVKDVVNTLKAEVAEALVSGIRKIEGQPVVTIISNNLPKQDEITAGDNF